MLYERIHVVSTYGCNTHFTVYNVVHRLLGNPECKLLRVLFKNWIEVCTYDRLSALTGLEQIMLENM